MGVTKDLIRAGDEKTYPKTGDELTMHYTGWLSRTDVKFDSSVDKGKPFVFKVGLGMVIKGWDEGIMEMSLGEIATLHVTSDYAYGEKGMPPVIPPHAELSFEVELLGIGKERAAGASICDAVCLVS